MESSSSRVAEEKRKQDDLLKQIAALQAQLKPETLIAVAVALPTSPKRKQPDSTVLAPPTPSPKKRKLDHRPSKSSSRVTGSNQNITFSRQEGATLSLKRGSEKPPPKPVASNLLTKLAQLKHRRDDSDHAHTVSRSSGFTDKPPVNDHKEDDVFGDSTAKRDERLALIEDLEPGPVDHIPPTDDPDFEKLEPNSGIRLASRTVPHEDLQDHLRGRFYLSPSRLYSAIRLLPDKQGYDIPVPGDWITIAVVAERGPLKFSRAPIAVGREEDDAHKKEHWKNKGKGKAEAAKPTGKKYVNLKLIDFGARARSSSSATGGKAIIRGDAFLSLLLFESDGFDLVIDEGETKPRKVYKGGSRGAFETMAKLKEGDVIALLNPRILKPYQRSSDNPHPTNNILAITPESAASIMGIGRAHDLGMCSVSKKDNSLCGSWYDKRVSDVCEWHVQHAVERRRAGRAEFSIGTTGMSSSSAPKRKPEYDPVRQWGLKPADDSGGSGATYIVSGHVVNGSKLDSRSLYAAEGIGREGQAKAKRISGKDADRALKNLLERDKEGMKAVMKAREVGALEDETRRQKKVSKKGKEKETNESKEKGSDRGDKREKGSKATVPAKNAYSAQVIKQLGFDPIAIVGQHRGGGDTDVQKKLDSLAAVQSARKQIALGPRSGQRIRSAVVAPPHKNSKGAAGLEGGELRDIDDLDDELYVNPPQVMIDLDD